MSGQTVPLTLDRDEALRYLGYSGQVLDEGLQARFEELASTCECTLHPQCTHATFPVDTERTRWEESDEHPQVVLAGCGLVLPGRDIARHLRGAREVVLMACTLGMESERELRKYAALGPTDALLYGAAASALVEAAADVCNEAIVEEAAVRGLFTNARYSPGYGDLPLSVQPHFLAALEGTRRMGLVATEGYALVPTKSVTALMGLFEGPQPDERGDSGNDRAGCATCAVRDRCRLKEKGRTCHG